MGFFLSNMNLSSTSLEKALRGWVEIKNHKRKLWSLLLLFRDDDAILTCLPPPTDTLSYTAAPFLGDAAAAGSLNIKTDGQEVWFEKVTSAFIPIKLCKYNQVKKIGFQISPSKFMALLFWENFKNPSEKLWVGAALTRSCSSLTQLTTS